jgi:hypothetical protein
MKTQIIQLESHDDIISTRDKLMWSKATRVLLVWPNRGKVMRQKLDLVLLLRHATDLGQQIALVSKDPKVIENAEDTGIPVYSSTLEAQRAVWVKPRQSRKNLKFKKVERKRSEELRHQLEKTKLPSLEASWARILVFLVGVVSVLALGIFLLPGATITLQLQQEEQSMEILITASPDIQHGSITGNIPAHVLSVVVETQGTLATTGSVVYGQEPASGVVEFTNLTDQTVTIPEGTVVRDISGGAQRYTTIRSLVLPAGRGSTGQIPVLALVPGSGGNLEADAIQAVEGSIGLQVSVTNPEAISGGTDETLPSPSDEDIDQLRLQVMTSLEDIASEQLLSMQQSGQMVVMSSLELSRVVVETSSPAIGEPADQVSMTIQAEYEIQYIDLQDVQDAAEVVLDVSTPQGYHSVDGTLIVTHLTEPELIEEAGIQWRINATRTLEADWQQQDVVHLAIGVPADTAIQSISNALLLRNSPSISLVPSWWFQMPYLPFRISVVTE